MPLVRSFLHMSDSLDPEDFKADPTAGDVPAEAVCALLGAQFGPRSGGSSDFSQLFAFELDVRDVLFGYDRYSVELGDIYQVRAAATTAEAMRLLRAAVDGLGPLERLLLCLGRPCHGPNVVLLDPFAPSPHALEVCQQVVDHGRVAQALPEDPAALVEIAHHSGCLDTHLIPAACPPPALWPCAAGTHMRFALPYAVSANKLAACNPVVLQAMALLGYQSWLRAQAVTMQTRGAKRKRWHQCVAAA